MSPRAAASVGGASASIRNTLPGWMSSGKGLSRSISWSLLVVAYGRLAMMGLLSWLVPDVAAGWPGHAGRRVSGAGEPAV